MRTGTQNRTLTGFTLIELMVVITIIALLMTALISGVQAPMLAAEKFADRANLHWHYAQLIEFKRAHGRLPSGGGHRFVLTPWVTGDVEHTETNRDRYFSAALSEDSHVHDLQSQPVDQIWKNLDSVSSADTHFAGRSKHGRRHMLSGKEVWMATDNEGGNTYRDGSILVLYGDNSVKELRRNPHLIPHGAPADPDAKFTMEVGEGSPHPDLKKLSK